MFSPINEPAEHTHVRKAIKVLNEAITSCDESPGDTVLTALALVTVNLLREATGDPQGRNLDQYISQLRLAAKIS